MTPAQRAVIAQAKKDGLPAMEISAEYICHSMMEVLLHQLRKREIAFNKLGERDQDSAIQDMQTELKKIALAAARMITANGCETVAATMKSLKIDGKLTATMVVDGEEPNRHILTDKAHDKSGILIVLYPNDFVTGLSDFQGEKDQKPLPLEEAGTGKPKAAKAPKAAPAAKVIELPPKLVEDCIAFVRNIQTATHAGIQNQFKINFEKAEALLVELENQGVVTEKDKDGNRSLVRVKAPAEAAPVAADQTEPAGDPVAAATVLTDEIYAKAKAKVIKDQEVSQSGLAVALDLSDELAAEVVDRLELDGVISEASDLGTREVFEQPA